MLMDGVGTTQEDEGPLGIRKGSPEEMQKFSAQIDMKIAWNVELSRQRELLSVHCRFKLIISH